MNEWSNVYFSEYYYSNIFSLILQQNSTMRMSTLIFGTKFQKVISILYT